MVDIRKNFESSFNLLIHHKKIMIPILIALLIPLVLSYLFLNLSGISSILTELVEFSEQGTPQVNTLSYAQYLEESGYNYNVYSQFINFKNILLLIIFLLLGFIGSFYFSCMSYAIITLAITNQTLSKSILIRVTNNFFFKLLSLKFVLLFLIVTPIAIISGITLLLFYLNKIVGGLFVLLFIILITIYIFIFTIRLFFVTPSLYLEKSGPIKAIKHSFSLTKGHTRQVLIIFFMIYGITVFMNSFIGKPLYGSYTHFTLGTNLIRITINFLLIVFFLILESFVFTFEHLFHFYSYIDFKQLKEVIKPQPKKLPTFNQK